MTSATTYTAGHAVPVVIALTGTPDLSRRSALARMTIRIAAATNARDDQAFAGWRTAPSRIASQKQWSGLHVAACH